MASDEASAFSLVRVERDELNTDSVAVEGAGAGSWVEWWL